MPLGKRKSALAAGAAPGGASREAAGAAPGSAAAGLPEELEDALRDFDGDLCGPWEALGLDLETVAELTEEEIRAAYRRAVRDEHPDRSSRPDAEERFRKVRKAYALLQDGGTRALLLEALEQDVGSLEELSSRAAEEGGGGSDGESLRWAIGVGVLLGIGVNFLRSSVGRSPVATPSYSARAIAEARARLEADAAAARAQASAAR